MPLPKPPSKRGDVLAVTDLAQSVASAHDETQNPPTPNESTVPSASDNVATKKKSTVAKKTSVATPPTLYVLDTNVLMHDPSSLFKFEEHDVYLPMITLEELDGHKSGMTEVSRNVRQVSRDLDLLTGKKKGCTREVMSQGFALNSTGHAEATGKLFLQTNLNDVKLPASLPDGKADNIILGVVEALCAREPKRNIVLVSKDINMRVKACALGLQAEDYMNDAVLEDMDLLYNGSLELPSNFWDTTADVQWDKKGECSIKSPKCAEMHINQFVYHESVGKPLYTRVIAVNGDEALLKVLKSFENDPKGVFGIKPKDAHDLSGRTRTKCECKALFRNYLHSSDGTHGKRYWISSWNRRREDVGLDGSNARQHGGPQR